MAKSTSTFPIDQEINSLVQIHEKDPGAIPEILRQIQNMRGNLTPESIRQIAAAIDVPASRVYGVASFYSMLSISQLEHGKVAPERTLRVCDGPVCWLHGATDLQQAARDILDHAGWEVKRSSCLGLCDRAPAALAGEQQVGPLSLSHLPDMPLGLRSEPVVYSQPRAGELRVMMALAGRVDPEEIDSAMSLGAYESLRNALVKKPGEIIDEVEASGLTGRGGAGFPVGRKWRFVAQAERFPKFVICNADESEPLIFKDRVLIDTHPHQILEGMAIAGYATGASRAFIYIRGEYEEQAKRLEKAIQQAEQRGLLGDQILGSEYSFHVHVHRGAGAYICGEETALIESLEGKRGEPRVRPPYPPTYGYRGMPTLVNNVESYATIPSILRNGAQWYRSLSQATTPGTKLYMVLGHVNQPGLFEAPFGLTLRQVIDDFGGGMRAGSNFNFALTGGAAGTIVPASLLDIPIDYASAGKGVSLGAGAFLICDQTVSVVSFLREILHFFLVESCGKCTPCRQGTRRAFDILEDLISNRGKNSDIDELHSLAEVMQQASFCGLGQSVAIPMKSALTHFHEAFLATTQ